MDYKKGELVCASCGLVIEDGLLLISKGKQVCKPQSTISKTDKGLSTGIGKGTGRMGPMKKAQIDRMANLHNKMTFAGSKERRLAVALDEIVRLSAQLRLPTRVREGGALIYRKARRAGITRGRRMEMSAAACVYLACRIHRIPLRIGEICRLADLEEKALMRRTAFLRHMLNMTVPAMEPADIVHTIVERLRMDGRTGRKAQRICREQLSAYGGKPSVIAAASIYLAARGQYKRTQAEVAKAAGVSENSLRSCCRIALDGPRS